MNTLPIILSASIAFAATLSAGIFIKKFKNNIGIVCALSAGFFIALALFDLLPEILTLAPEAQISLVTLLLTGSFGFVFLFVLERVFSLFHIKTAHDDKNKFSAENWIDINIGILFSWIS